MLEVLRPGDDFSWPGQNRSRSPSDPPGFPGLWQVLPDAASHTVEEDKDGDGDAQGSEQDEMKYDNDMEILKEVNPQAVPPSRILHFITDQIPEEGTPQAVPQSHAKKSAAGYFKNKGVKSRASNPLQHFRIARKVLFVFLIAMVWASGFYKNFEIEARSQWEGRQDVNDTDAMAEWGVLARSARMTRLARRAMAAEAYGKSKAASNVMVDMGGIMESPRYYSLRHWATFEKALTEAGAAWM